LVVNKLIFNFAGFFAVFEENGKIPDSVQRIKTGATSI
jgi:hypothetical protein